MSNNTMKFLVTYIIVMIILQKVFTIPQTKRIAKKMKEIQKLGICSAGVGRNTFGLKIYYIIVADSQGNVIN